MAAEFPGAVKSFTDVTDDVTEMEAVNINPLYAEVTAIETELGTDPAGTATDVKTRLARSLDGKGNLDFATSSELTIGASGDITPTQNWHTVDTAADAATDDLVTIEVTNCSDGFVLFLRQVNDARDVTVKHGTGNIKCPGGVDIVLTDTTQSLILIYDATLTSWLVAVSPSNGALVNAINSFTAMNSFTKSVNFAYTSVSAATTLDTTHYMVDVDCTAAGRTIALPTAVGCNGREYVIRKLDASGNYVTIDGDGAETINGAATKILTSQYDTATLMSNGAGWNVL